MAVLSSGVALASEDSFAPILQSEQRAASSLCGVWRVPGNYAALAARWDTREQEIDAAARGQTLYAAISALKKPRHSGASVGNTLVNAPSAAAAQTGLYRPVPCVEERKRVLQHSSCQPGYRTGHAVSSTALQSSVSTAAGDKRGRSDGAVLRRPPPGTQSSDLDLSTR